MTAPATDEKPVLTEWDVISRDIDVVSGAPVFRGTRVPVVVLFDYLLRGKALNDFYDEFPTVTPEHVLAVLRSARDHVSLPIFLPRDAADRERPRGAYL